MLHLLHVEPYQIEVVNRLHSMKLLWKLPTKLISIDRLTDVEHPTISQKVPIYLKS